MCQIIISVICILLAVTVSTAPMKRKCTPCSIYCSMANPAVTGPSCWSCQCEPAANSSYEPSNTSTLCNSESCQINCGIRGFKIDARGCPICQCRIIARRKYPS